MSRVAVDSNNVPMQFLTPAPGGTIVHGITDEASTTAALVTSGSELFYVRTSIDVRVACHAAGYAMTDGALDYFLPAGDELPVELLGADQGGRARDRISVIAVAAAATGSLYISRCA